MRWRVALLSTHQLEQRFKTTISTSSQPSRIAGSTSRRQRRQQGTRYASAGVSSLRYSFFFLVYSCNNYFAYRMGTGTIATGVTNGLHPRQRQHQHQPTLSSTNVPEFVLIREPYKLQEIRESNVWFCVVLPKIEPSDFTNCQKSSNVVVNNWDGFHKP